MLLVLASDKYDPAEYIRDYAGVSSAWLPHDGGVVDLLICPVCRSSDLRLVAFSAAGDVVHDGIVQCLGCGAQYPIEAGSSSLLPPPLWYENDRRAFFGRWSSARRAVACPTHREFA